MFAQSKGVTLKPADLTWARSTFWKLDSDNNGNLDKRECRDFILAFHDRFLTINVKRISLRTNLIGEFYKEFEKGANSENEWASLKTKVNTYLQNQGLEASKADLLWMEHSFKIIKKSSKGVNDESLKKFF